MTEIKGLDNLLKQFDKLKDNSSELSEKPIGEKKLLNDIFIKKYTKFSNWEEMYQQALKEYVENKLFKDL
jgi:hypothetical protein